MDVFKYSSRSSGGKDRIMYKLRHDVANKDIRIACIENGIKFWQIAQQLDEWPETISRKLRTELSPEEKKRFFKAIELIIRGK